MSVIVFLNITQLRTSVWLRGRDSPFQSLQETWPGSAEPSRAAPIFQGAWNTGCHWFHRIWYRQAGSAGGTWPFLSFQFMEPRQQRLSNQPNGKCCHRNTGLLLLLQQPASCTDFPAQYHAKLTTSLLSHSPQSYPNSDHKFTSPEPD